MTVATFNANLKQGDKIKLIQMPDDPLPVETGTKGTVVSIYNSNIPEYFAVTVDWEPEPSTGQRRSLFLAGIDLIEILERS